MMITIYHFYLYPQKFFLGIHTDWNKIKWLLFSSIKERPYKLHSGTIKQHIDYNKTKLNKGNPSLISFTDLGVSTWMETRLKVAFLEIRGVGGGNKHVWNPESPLPPATSTFSFFCGSSPLVYLSWNWVSAIVKIWSDVARFSLCFGFWQLENPYSWLLFYSHQHSPYPFSLMFLMPNLPSVHK